MCPAVPEVCPDQDRERSKGVSCALGAQQHKNGLETSLNTHRNKGKINTGFVPALAGVGWAGLGGL